MNIVICEDDSSHLKYIRDCIEQVICSEELKSSIVLATASPSEVIRYIKSNESLTLYFLDVNLNSNIDGIELATMIRKKDGFSFIVFITAYEDKLSLTFKYRLSVLDYIVKGSLGIGECIKECVTLAYSRLNKTNDNLITLTNKYSKICIKKDDIYFIESIKLSHKLLVNYKNGEFEIRGNLKDMLDELGENFKKCNKSLIVNLDKVVKINSEDNSIILDNGVVCYYSKSFSKGDII